MDNKLTPTRDFTSLSYAEGFGNHVCSEALPNALPKG